jgi:hypothetical protein
MFDYREYFIAVAAIFLALALGILIGISFGDDYLVANQREIIRLMEQELERQKGTVLSQEIELQRWEQVKPLLWRGYAGVMAGKRIAILSRDEERAKEVAALFREAGAGVAVLISPQQPGAESVTQFLALLAGGSPLETLAGQGFGVKGEAAMSWPPDSFILLPDGDGGSPGSFFLHELWQVLALGGNRVIACFPWQEDIPAFPLSFPRDTAVNLVDNIDTFWGKVALLEMTAYDRCGHYGYGRGRVGLLPAVIYP